MSTVVFFPEGAYGPTNNCVGIGQVLRDRGHRVVFVLEESFAGTLEAQGFEERLMRLGPPPEVEEEPGQFWKDFIRDTAPVFRTPTIEQLTDFIEPTWRALCDGARYVDDRLREIFDEVAPGRHRRGQRRLLPRDPPLRTPVGAHRLVQPARGEGRRDPAGLLRLPRQRPHGLGRVPAGVCGARSPGCTASSRPSATSAARHRFADGEFIHESDWLNLYLYPAEVDYARGTPLAPTWHRLDTCVRREQTVLGLPSEIVEGEGGLVYLSLGSLGSADVDLMKRLVDVLSRAPHRFVVSKGPQASEFELADNMWGDEFVPQPALLPLADVVITHAGNNTTTECFHFGKPMIALPLFWDQYDNAQRVAETGYGIRLQTYEFEDGELLDANRPAPRRRGAPRAHGRHRGARAGGTGDREGGRSRRAARARGAARRELRGLQAETNVCAG